MDKKLTELAKLYALAMVNAYQAPIGDANRVPEERREALKQLEKAQQELSQRAWQVAQNY